MSEKQKNMRQAPDESITADQEGAGAQESESQCMWGEETIGSSEGSYLALVQNLPGIVYRLFPGEGSRMVFFNDAVREMTGFAPEELHHGERCNQCGECQKRCVKQLDVIEWLARAHRLLSGSG